MCLENSPAPEAQSCGHEKGAGHPRGDNSVGGCSPTVLAFQLAVYSNCLESTEPKAHGNRRTWDCSSPPISPGNPNTQQSLATTALPHPKPNLLPPSSLGKCRGGKIIFPPPF